MVKTEVNGHLKIVAMINGEALIFGSRSKEILALKPNIVIPMECNDNFLSVIQNILTAVTDGSIGII